MRFRCFFFTVSFFLLGNEALAQQMFILRGVISKKLTVERIPLVVVSNLRTKELMMSDELGWFSIKVAIGDTLIFSKVDFTEQKIVVSSTSDIPVNMQPVIKLAEVTIKGESKKQELQDFQKDYARKGVYYNGNPPLASMILNPLNDLHTWFGKDASNLRRFKADSKNEIEYDEVHRRYTLKLVKKVTTANDSLAKKFMEYYTPSYEDMKGWNDYDLITQIKKSYDYFMANKDRLQLQNINAPILVKPLTGKL